MQSKILGAAKPLGFSMSARDRAAQVAERFAIKAFSSLQEMLDDANVNVVCVATPNHLHRDAVIQAAKAGKHVLTEKPPAMSLKRNG